MFSRSTVKIQGRYVLADGVLWMISSCCEVSFQLEGATYLTFDLESGSVDSFSLEKQAFFPRYAVYANEKLLLDNRLEASYSKITVFENSNPDSRLIRFVKLSDCLRGHLGLCRITTDGILHPVPEHNLRIEFIGDSITAGYGVEGDLGQDFTTATENAEKTFGYYTASELNADFVLTAFSGHGVLSGYTEGDINTESLVQSFYDRVGKNAVPLPNGKRLQDMPWDFSSWQPDYIVLNVGTNDASWCGDIPERKDKFREKYEQFLVEIRRFNPSARILCVLGIMGESLCPYMRQAVTAYSHLTGDTAIRSLCVREQNRFRDGVGTNNHPSCRTQRILADHVIYALRTWMSE